MSLFSPSGIYQLPAVTESLLTTGLDPRVKDWLLEAVQEGDRFNSDDPGYSKVDRAMRYINGDQYPEEGKPPFPYLLQTPINELRKGVQAHVSALTDLKPTFAFVTSNPQFDFQADLLNKLVINWWVSSMADVQLGQAIKYALVAGTGDLLIEWDPAAPGGGNHAIRAVDPRDTLPLRPGQHPSPQFWQGVVFREAWPLQALAGKYPQQAAAGLFLPTPDSFLSTVKGWFARRAQRPRVISPGSVSPLDFMGGASTAARPIRPGDVIFFRATINDKTCNLTGKPITMGDSSSNWSYVVPHGGRLYPNKRLLLATDRGMVYDGPAPYWHGQYPFARLKLWDLPWLFFGSSLVNDVMGIQDALNQTMGDLRLAFRQWVDRETVFDTKQISRSFVKAYDTRKPGNKINLSSAISDPEKAFIKVDGVPVQALQFGLEIFQVLTSRIRELMGTANLEALLNVRGQLPSGDTMKTYYEMLTPELRNEGRQAEIFLREVAEQWKFNTFQFYDRKKRMTVLGEAGVMLSDFDADPDVMVPGLAPEEPGYLRDFDASKPRAERAKAMAQLMTFRVKPNSLLAFNAIEIQMKAFQMARMGYMDIWTLGERLEEPAIGAPPPFPLPPLEPLPQFQSPEEMAIFITMSNGRYTLDPMSGQIMEIRSPVTIPERLVVQASMGIGLTESPAGRKASGGNAPQQEEKSDGEGGSRQTMTESKK